MNTLSKHLPATPYDPSIDRYVGEKEASTIVGLSIPMLQKLRWKGGGPMFCKTHRRVTYRIRTLLEWMESNTRISTTAEAV